MNSAFGHRGLSSGTKVWKHRLNHKCSALGGDHETCEQVGLVLRIDLAGERSARRTGGGTDRFHDDPGIRGQLRGYGNLIKAIGPIKIAGIDIYPTGRFSGGTNFVDTTSALLAFRKTTLPSAAP
jgi:hypothetical protein